VRHHGPLFAMLLARLIGYRDPLIRRLRDPAVPKTDDELKYIADVLADPTKDRRTPNQVTESRDKLRRAAIYLECLYTGGKETVAEAEESAASRCKLDERTIRRAVKYAKALGGGEWWRSAEHLAKKGPRKHESLHRTY
jgi:hypothetical protein